MALGEKEEWRTLEGKAPGLGDWTCGNRGKTEMSDRVASRKEIEDLGELI